MPLKQTYQPMVKKGLDALFNNQPLPDMPGCESMEKYDENEEIYQALVRSEGLYPRIIRDDLHGILVRNKSPVTAR